MKEIRHPSKAKISILVLIAFVAGGLTGGLTSQTFFPAKIATTEEQGENSVANEKSDINIDKDDGLGLTPPEMLEELQLMEPGNDFDWRYMNYVTLMRNNEIGMARIAERKASHPELQQEAVSQKEQSKTLVDKMYSWTKLWGFTHH